MQRQTTEEALGDVPKPKAQSSRINVFFQGVEVDNRQEELREWKHACKPAKKWGGRTWPRSHVQSSWNHSEALEALGRERERVLGFSVGEDRHFPEEAQNAAGSCPQGAP